MKISICSYSFNRLLAAGKQDIFKYITDCKDLGCTQLDPWMAHLAPIQAACADWRKKPDPHKSEWFLTSDEIRYLSEVKRAADKVNLPFGCIAVDGGHMYEKDESTRNGNRAIAYRWIDACAVLGATQIRLDSGGNRENPKSMTEEELAIIAAGFKDVIARAKPRGIEVVIENHWGPTKYPENIIRILDAVPGLGMLWDAHNFAPEVNREARVRTAKYATITHFKTFKFDATGTDPSEDLPQAVKALKEVGYKGTWGVESCPVEMDELEAARKTIDVLKKLVAG